MFTLSNLLCDYKDLLDDKLYLEGLNASSVEKNSHLEALLLHNTCYISHIEKFLRDHIPESFSDFNKLSYMDISNWFKIWKKYPNLYSGREEKLICLFQSIAERNFENWEMYRDDIKGICFSDGMIYFAATALPCKRLIVDALFFVVSKCSSLNEGVEFYNKVELKKREL